MGEEKAGIIPQMSRSGPPQRPTGPLLAACLASLLLTGCDVLLVSPTLPGLLPGLGQPLRGQVVDALTGQPIGHASVMGDLGKGDVGWATTDNNGDFALYGDISRQVVSISRAGYTSVTYEDGNITDGRQYLLQPLFPDSGLYHHVQEPVITGTIAVANGSQLQPAPALTGTVFFGSQSTPFGQGTFAFPSADNSGGLPGNVYSGVLSGGVLVANSNPGANFSYQTSGNTIEFDDQVVSVPFPDEPSATATWSDPVPLVMNKNLYTTADVSFGNIDWATQVETDISIDFGLLGSILVARQFASQQTGIAVPTIGSDLRYILTGLASNADRTQTSQVTISTNQPSLANFPLLSPPKPLSPPSGAKGVGAHPIFSWSPVASADSYVVKVIEQDNPLPKWEAVVSGSTTAIGYPWFSDGDVNGGALLPGASYSWEVHAISASFEGTSPAAAMVRPQDGPIFQPFNQRTLESVTKGMTFTR